MQEFAWIDADTVGTRAGAAGQLRRGTAASVRGQPARACASVQRALGPRVTADTRVREIAHNTPVFVTDAVRGDDGETWYRIGEEEYLRRRGPTARRVRRRCTRAAGSTSTCRAHAANRIRGRPRVPRWRCMARCSTRRRWASTAFSAASRTRPWTVPRWAYRAMRRAATPAERAVHAVLHRRRRRDPLQLLVDQLRVPGTHGCLGVNLDDAKWFWDWASVGTCSISTSQQARPGVRLPPAIRPGADIVAALASQNYCRSSAAWLY